VDSRLWFQWQVVIQIATGLQFDNEDDAMIWKFNSSGRFSVHSLYAIVNEGLDKFTLQWCGGFLSPLNFISSYGFCLITKH
jgi:hypothetical protein